MKPDDCFQLHRPPKPADFPAAVCCVCRHAGATVPEKYDAMYCFYHECVDKGYVLDSKPLFIVNERTDYLEGQLSSSPDPFQVCVPVLPEKAPADAVHFPSCTALSVLYYGDYSDIGKAWLKLGSEAKKRELTPSAFPRVIGIVAPYTGREIDSKWYCSRIVMPVE